MNAGFLEEEKIISEKIDNLINNIFPKKGIVLDVDDPNTFNFTFGFGNVKKIKISKNALFTNATNGLSYYTITFPFNSLDITESELLKQNILKATLIFISKACHIKKKKFLDWMQGISTVLDFDFEGDSLKTFDITYIQDTKSLDLDFTIKNCYTELIDEKDKKDENKPKKNSFKFMCPSCGKKFFIKSETTPNISATCIDCGQEFMVEEIEQQEDNTPQ